MKQHFRRFVDTPASGHSFSQVPISNIASREEVVVSTGVLSRSEGDFGVLEVDLPVVEHQERRVQGGDPHVAHQQVRLRFLRKANGGRTGGGIRVGDC